jgi:hypothetical protein
MAWFKLPFGLAWFDGLGFLPLLFGLAYALKRELMFLSLAFWLI